MKPLSHVPAVLSIEEDVLLFLIREELKYRKVLHALHIIGLYDTEYDSALGELIVSCAGLDATSDAALDHYYQLLEKHVAGLVPGKEAIRQAASDLYRALKEMQ